MGASSQSCSACVFSLLSQTETSFQGRSGRGIQTIRSAARSSRPHPWGVFDILIIEKGFLASTTRCNRCFSEAGFFPEPHVMWQKLSGAEGGSISPAGPPLGKKGHLALARWLSWLECCPICSRLGPWSGHMQEAADRCFPPSLVLPLFKKINKYILR